MGPIRVLYESYENIDLIRVSWQGSDVHIILALEAELHFLFFYYTFMPF